jgi:hypothetical protein
MDWDNEDGTKCAHDLIVGSKRYGGMLPISTYLRTAPRCAECRILVQLVDEYPPGWIAANKDSERGALSVSLWGGYTVELVLVQPGRWSRERKRFVKMDYEEMGKFQFFTVLRV